MTNSRFALVASTLAALAGCADKPPVSYQRPVELSELTTHLQAAQIAAPQGGHVMLSSETTTGRFACDLAIARFEPDAAGGLVLALPRPADQARWTETLRGIREIRGVSFLTPRSTKLDGDALDALCAVARRQGAPLLLAYADAQTGATAGQTAGVVYSSETGAALAAVRAAGASADPELAEREGDHRGEDGRFQAQRRFEHSALECVRTLIHADQPAPTTQPHVWQQPMVERWWIRRRN